MKYISFNPIVNWNMRLFLIAILAIQLALYGVIGLDAIGIHIPIIRPFISYVYLTFVPGLLIIRVLKLQNISNIEVITYSVGLSVSILMFAGLVLNWLGHIGLIPLIIMLSFIVLFLGVLSYVKGEKYVCLIRACSSEYPLILVLVLCLVPVLCIFGVYAVNWYHNNIYLMFLMVVISILIVLTTNEAVFTRKLFPLMLYIISVSLLYHISLITEYLVGWDIHIEHYLANLVIINSSWDPMFEHSCNGMLSIVMLAPIYSIISGSSLTWTFKLMYPFIFSFVPIILYIIYKTQTSERIAFLSVIFFMSVNRFYYPMPRQNVAELFMALILLLIVSTNISRMQKSMLLTIFSISLIISHYGTSYIFIFVISLVWLVQFMLIKLKTEKKYNIYYDVFAPNKFSLRGTFVLFSISFMLFWYIYSSSSLAFIEIIRVYDRIFTSLFTDIFSPDSTKTLQNVLDRRGSVSFAILIGFHLITQLFISIGLLLSLKNLGDLKFKSEYIIFSLFFYLLCVCAVFVPYLADQLNVDRLYHITLFVLSPFCIIGGLKIFKILENHFLERIVRNRQNSFGMLSIFLSVFFLFNTGFIHDIANDMPWSISLSQEKIKIQGDAQISNFFNIYIPEQDVFGAKWLAKNHNIKYNFYSDVSTATQKSSVLVSVGGIDYRNLLGLTNTTLELRDNSYIYIRYLNIVMNIMSSKNPANNYRFSDHFDLMINKNKIYSNGGSVVLLSCMQELIRRN